ncbi:hypothetical protein T190_30910 [Sinorhizobium meliloti CCBAU 01290]|nr:hypothetical protein T190_30910 [Sinorhizobium meliloti CCBAU 01290]
MAAGLAWRSHEGAWRPAAETANLTAKVTR